MAKKSSKLAELNSVFKENSISADTVELSDELIFEIKKKAAIIKDYRHESYTRHLLVDVVMITFFAMLANANEWADALNCQKETVATIAKSKGDYVLAIKGNQKNFYEEIKDFFIEETLEEIKKKNKCYYKTIEKEHSGIAIREYYITDDITWHYICSIEPDAELFARASRSHWGGVENNLHWMLDFTFYDDKNTS